MTEATQISYNFKKPSQWDAFMVYSKTVTEPEQPPQQQANATRQIWDFAEQTMDVEEQEVLRYYGLGIGICGLMRVVMPEPGPHRVCYEGH